MSPLRLQALPHARYRFLMRIRSTPMDARRTRLHAQRGAERASAAQLWQALRDQPELADGLSAAIRDAGYAGLFFECAPCRPPGEQPWEAMLLHSSTVASLVPQPGPFSAQLRDCRERDGIRCFPNLSGDATLVVPCPGPGVDAAHLQVFLQQAPRAQIRRLWSAVGREVCARLAAGGDRPASQRPPLWVSTSGLGVSWLHLRLDRRPKYYTNRPYRKLRSS